MGEALFACFRCAIYLTGPQILQEVALARSILLVCGKATVHGDVFCRGLARLRHLTESNFNLHTRISSLAYLINGAPLRPKYSAQDHTPTAMARGTLLPELIDMYHNREATIPNDRVYALLGMTSDPMERKKFHPNYDLSWESLLHALTQHCLGSQVSITVLPPNKVAINGQGTVIGRVVETKPNSAVHDLQQMTVAISDTPEASRYEALWGKLWTIQQTAKAIHSGDIICILHGADRPTLIRASGHSFSVIVIAIIPRRNLQPAVECATASKPEKRADTEGMCDFSPFSPDRRLSLIWDWDIPSASASDSAERHDTSSSGDFSPEEKLYEAARIMIDIGEHEKARSRIFALRESEPTLGHDHPLSLASLDLTAFTYAREDDWEKAIAAFSSAWQSRRAVQGPEHSSTLESLCRLATAHAKLANSANQDVFALRRLVMRVQKDQPLSEGDVQRLIQFRSKALLSLLFSQGGSCIPITSKIVRQVKQYYAVTDAMDIMDLLLRKYPGELILQDSVVSTILAVFDEPQLRSLFASQGERICVTDSVIRTAIGLGDYGVAVLELLLTRWEGPLSQSLPEDLALAALRNPKAQRDVVELMLKRHLGDVDLTDDITMAILGNEKHGLDILEALKSYQGGEVHVKLTSYGLEEVVRSETHGAETLRALGTLRKHHALFGDEGGITLTTDVLIAAVSNQREGLEIFKMLAEQRDIRDLVTMDVAQAAACSVRHGTAIMSLVMQLMGSRFRVTTELVKWAAKNEGDGYGVMLLLHRHHTMSDIELTSDIVETVTKNGLFCSLILRLLFNQMKDNIPPRRH